MRLKQGNLSVKIGSTRLLKRFAWLPMVIAGQIIWLEMYEILQAYIGQQYQILIEDKPAMFTVSNWITLSKRVMQ